MCLTIDLQECFLCDLATILLPLRLLLSPVPLQDAEYNNIKTLVYMHGVCRIAEDMDFSGVGIVKELERVVGVVAINNQQAGMSIRFSLGISIKVF